MDVIEYVLTEYENDDIEVAVYEQLCQVCETPFSLCDCSCNAQLELSL